MARNFEVEVIFHVVVEAESLDGAIEAADAMYRSGEFARGVADGRWEPVMEDVFEV